MSDRGAPPGPLLEAFARLRRDRGGQPAIWSHGEDRRLTFGELGEEADRWAAELPLPPAAGAPVALATGGPVALATGNSWTFPALFLALRARGHAVLALDAGLSSASKTETCRRLGVPTLLHRDPPAAGDEPLAAGVALRRVPQVEPAQLLPDTALIKLTSGSTGEAEGLCLSEQELATGIGNIAAGMELTAGQRVLIAIPLAHSYGFDNGVLSLIAVGTPLVIENTFYPNPLLRALAEGEVEFFPAVPPMVRALAEADWPADLPLARVISAGGPLRSEFARGFRRASGLPVHQFYGSTETGGISFETAPEEADAAGTVGFPLPGVAVTLGAGGQVQVDSAATFHARLGDPARRRDRRVLLGDRGEWSDHGRLRLIGRVADLLNVGGRRVSAAAVESALLRLPGIAEAAVVAIADPLRGDRVVAFVVPDAVPEGGGPPTGEARRERRLPFDCSELPAGLAPRQVHLLEALPHTERGKLDRARLRALAGRSRRGKAD